MFVLADPNMLVRIHPLAGVEINFFCYLQKIASAMISNLLNASWSSQNEK